MFWTSVAALLVLGGIAGMAHAQLPFPQVSTPQPQVEAKNDQPDMEATSRAVYIRNKTDRKVLVAATFLSAGKWQTQGFWDVSPGETVGPVFESNSRFIYLYANSEDGQIRWSGSDVFRNLSGQRYGFKKFDVKTGSGTHLITLQ